LAVQTKFDKPGQKRETPPELDCLRMFYESLWREREANEETSDMAEKWLLYHGVFDMKKAVEIAANYANGKGGNTNQSPVKKRKADAITVKKEPIQVKKEVKQEKQVKAEDSEDEEPLMKKVKVENSKPVKSEKPTVKQENTEDSEDDRPLFKK
jgi:hypothetical protein